MSENGTRTTGWRAPAARRALDGDRSNRAEAHARKLLPLDLPYPVRVETDTHDRPVKVHMNRKAYGVLTVREQWRIDDEWWRAPISRSYVSLVLDDGRPLTIYEDLANGGWYVHGSAIARGKGRR